MMLPVKFQKESASKRKAVIQKVSRAFVSLDKAKFPYIYGLINSSNTRKVAVLNMVIEQMYSLGFELNESLLAVEENI
jgi:hypothetical protein